MMIGTSGGTHKMDQNGRFQLEKELENPMNMDNLGGTAIYGGAEFFRSQPVELPGTGGIPRTYGRKFGGIQVSDDPLISFEHI